MTKKYPTEVLLSITTGCLLCDFSDMHECCEFVAGEPIFTHQFAHAPFVALTSSAESFEEPLRGNSVIVLDNGGDAA